MLATVIGKEIRDLIGSTAFAVTFGVCAVLILLSFYVGAANYKLAVAQNDASEAENLRQMEGLTDWFSLEQHRIFLAPQPLEALVTGIGNDIGRTTEVKTRGELTAEDSRFNEDPIYAAFRFLDLNFVFQIVLSLFAILFGYDAISGEKERGTLRLVFANAIPRATFILGKLIGSFVALALSLVVAILLGCCLLPILGLHLTGDEWLRLAAIIVSGLLYFGAFLTLAVFVSAITQRTSSSFVALLVIWIAAVLIVPRTAVLLAGRSVDVPSVDELAAQKATFSRQLWKEFRDQLNSFKPSPAEDMEVLMASFNQFMDSVTTERDRKMDDFAGRLNEGRFNRQKVQERLAFSLARVSPAASLSLASAKLAGTSVDLKNRFFEAARAYRETFNAFMKEKTGMNVGGRMIMFKSGDDEEAPEPIDPRELPAFRLRAVSFGEAVAASAVDIGLLAFFNLVFFTGAFIGFLRYDLR
ncbi:MAG TPA: ABC transporter permease subunit [Acidobacteriota bacterium]|nr:ABC transporter permease subunit [Acidobacteriota bacterium]